MLSLPSSGAICIGRVNDGRKKTLQSKCSIEFCGHKRIAVKIVDDRGIESSKVMELDG
jgi:hypothetical protein